MAAAAVRAPTPRWFGRGWQPPGKRVEAQRIKVPVGRKCHECDEKITIIDQGFLIDSPWDKLGHVYHRQCMPAAAQPAKPAPEPTPKEEAAPVFPTMLSNGAAKPVPEEEKKPATIPPPPLALVPPPPPTPLQEAEPEPEPPAAPPARVPQRGEMAALLRSFGRAELEAMSLTDLTLAAKKRGLFLTLRQAYMARHRTLAETPKPRAAEPKPAESASVPSVTGRDYPLDPKKPTARLYEFLKAHFATHGAAPSTALMMRRSGAKDAFGLASSLRTLEGRGLVTWQKGDYSSLRLATTKAAPKSVAPVSAARPTKAAKAKPAAEDGIRAQLEALIAKVERDAEEEIARAAEAIRAKATARKEALRRALEALD